jgi:ATP/maltotriose-dependent transcriptional regulator MalT
MSPAVRLMGDWDRSLAICAEVLADEGSTLLARRVAEEESGLITALRGDRRRARGPLRRAAEFGRANGIFGLEVGATWGLALVAVLEEDEGAARSTVATLLERCRTTEECHYALPALRWAASFLAQCDDADGVGACHRLVATLATRNGSPKVLSTLAHVGAELAVVDGDGEQAEAQFARSVELLTGITAPYERAHSQWRWGRTSAAVENRDAAVRTLASAYRTARRLAAKPLARRCASALAEMGEQVDSRLGRLATRALEPAGLTRREQEVLRHLVDGKTNREIAAELFLSTRTVDMHVRNLFTKLDCSSRTTVVRRASQRGLLPTGA